MSYTIIVRTTDTTQGRFFLSEKTVWHYANGGTWSDTNGVQTLIMGGSGTSGGIRLVSSDRTEVIFVAVGVHNYKPWCDIVPDLSLAADTSLKVHPQYYGPERSAIREEQAVLIERTSAKGRKLTVEYTSQDKNVLRVHVTIA
ncbi:lectin [Amylocystis lapponica]|nr:lectin [Amylocystis lapponica]